MDKEGNKRALRLNLLGRKGQVTIFIIIAVIIVALVFLVYSFYPQIKTNFGFGEKTPQAYIQACIEENIKDAAANLSLQGGSLAPENYILYENSKVEYLCYTEEYYKTCIVQQPMLKQHIESEIENDIKEEVKTCFDSLEESYRNRGYNVNLKRGVTNIELLPQKIVSAFNSSLVLTKSGNSEKYDSFRIVLNNNLYELVGITDSILEWEATYGDAETTVYMDYYHNLKVEKKKQSDGSTVYIITDRNTENKFQFASRSVAWPAGYGIGK